MTSSSAWVDEPDSVSADCVPEPAGGLLSAWIQDGIGKVRIDVVCLLSRIRHLIEDHRIVAMCRQPWSRLLRRPQ